MDDTTYYSAEEILAGMHAQGRTHLTVADLDSFVQLGYLTKSPDGRYGKSEKGSQLAQVRERLASFLEPLGEYVLDDGTRVVGQSLYFFITQARNAGIDVPTAYFNAESFLKPIGFRLEHGRNHRQQPCTVVYDQLELERRKHLS